MNDEVCLEVWGDFACFAPPYGKVERLTYPVPTPSAVRGILSSIYAKKTEFYWQVTQIEVLNPIRYMSFQRNELKSAVSAKPDMEKSILYTDEERTQRQTQVLKNVRYRIRARICPRPSYAGSLEQLYRQAMRRIRSGKTFMQPCLGLREFVCYFEESDGSRPPIDVSMDLGLMVYDIFDLHDEQVHRALLVIIQLAEVEDEAEFCIRQVRGDEFACRRVMTDKIVDGHAEVVRNAGQNGNVRLGIAVLILVD